MIGVLIRRRACFRVLGSTLDALTRRGVEWTIWDKPDAKDPPDSNDYGRWMAPGRFLHSDGTRHGVVKPKVWLAVDAPDVPNWNIPTVTVPYFWDNRLAPQPSNRIVCYTSERHLRLVQILQPGTPAGPIVGWTEGDAWALLQRDPCPLAVLYTLKQQTGDPWRQSLRGRAWYRETCRMIARDAKRRGYVLVVKSRAKHDDPRWLHFLSWQYIQDQETYPSTSWKLLALAQEVTHFVSGVAWEAMVAGVPHRAIRVPLGPLADYPGRREIEPAFDGTVSREQFLGDWILPVDGKAGERVADVIQGLL